MGRKHFVVIYVGLAMIVAALLMLEFSGYYVWNTELWRRAFVGFLAQPIEMFSGVGDPENGGLVMMLLLAVIGSFVVLAGLVWWSVWVVLSIVGGAADRANYVRRQKRAGNNRGSDAVGNLGQGKEIQVKTEAPLIDDVVQEVMKTKVGSEGEVKPKKRGYHWFKKGREIEKVELGVIKPGSGMKDEKIDLEGRNKKRGENIGAKIAAILLVIIAGIAGYVVTIARSIVRVVEEGLSKNKERKTRVYEGEAKVVEEKPVVQDFMEEFKKWGELLNGSGVSEATLQQEAKRIWSLMTERQEAELSGDLNSSQKLRMLKAWAETGRVRKKGELEQNGIDPLMARAIAEAEQSEGIEPRVDQEFELEKEDVTDLKLDPGSLAMEHLFHSGEIFEVGEEEKKPDQEEEGLNGFVDDLDDMPDGVDETKVNKMMVDAAQSTKDVVPDFDEAEIDQHIAKDEARLKGRTGSVDKDIEERKDEIAERIEKEAKERAEREKLIQQDEDFAEKEFGSIDRDEQGKVDAGVIFDYVTGDEKETEAEIEGKNRTADDKDNYEKANDLMREWRGVANRLGKRREMTAMAVQSMRDGNMRIIGMHHLTYAFANGGEVLYIMFRYVPEGIWTFKNDDGVPKVIDKKGNYVEVSDELINSGATQRGKVIVHFYGEGNIEGCEGKFQNDCLVTDRVLEPEEVFSELGIGTI